MRQEDEYVELVPGLRRVELKRAVSLVSDASGNNGFMMAWQNTDHPYRMGFCYIVNAKNYWSAIYAVTIGIADPLQFTSSHVTGYGNMEDFIEQYLKSSAACIGAKYAELVNGLAKQSSLWRFESFIDGKSDNRWRDNGIAWRALWGRIVETSDKAVIHVPHDVRESVQHKLVSFATSGQIVLNR